MEHFMWSVLIIYTFVLLASNFMLATEHDRVDLDFAVASSSAMGVGITTTVAVLSSQPIYFLPVIMCFWYGVLQYRSTREVSTQN